MQNGEYNIETVYFTGCFFIFKFIVTVYVGSIDLLDAAIKLQQYYLNIY